jgi:hypothetical protein
LGFVQGRLNNLSADVISQSGGSAKTAREVTVARNIALELTSLFLSFIEFGQKSKYTLRLANMFQFYTMPIDVDKDGKEIFREFKIASGKLMFGGDGVKIVRFVDEENMPVFSQELANEKRAIMGESNIIKINVNKLKDFKAILKIIPRSSVKDSDAMETAKELEFVDRTLGNPLFDQVEIAKALALAFKKDPAKVMAKQQQQPDQMREALMGGQTSEFVDQMNRGGEQTRFQGTKDFSLNNVMKEGM